MLLLLASLARATTCANYAEPEAYSVAGLPVESSGIVESRVRKGVWFTQPDGGNDAEIYSFDLESGFRSAHRVKGIANGDWEDIAAGPCPDGEACLYVADIGDNDLVRDTIEVGLVREPEEDGETLDKWDLWELSYPDGPHDAEAMVVHPCTGAVYLFTKDPDETELFRVPADVGHGVATLELVARFSDDASGFDFEDGLTGADWDADGERLVVRSAARLWEWTTDPADPDGHWSTEPRRVNDIDEVQGEAVGFRDDGAIVTGSEGTPMQGNVLQCAGAEPAAQECAFEPLYSARRCGCDTATAPAASGWLGLAALLAAARRRVRSGR